MSNGRRQKLGFPDHTINNEILAVKFTWIENEIYGKRNLSININWCDLLDKIITIPQLIHKKIICFSYKRLFNKLWD